jgi:hypothetical protein
VKMPHHRLAVFSSASVVVVALSCAQSPTTPSVGSQHVVISDPIGDVVADPRIAVSPDLASATVDVANGNVTFVVQFAPGTVDPSTTWVRIELDSDQNSATGNREQNGMGSDYDLLLLANGKTASVQTYDPARFNPADVCPICVGQVPITFTGDTLQVSVPLSMLANNRDGHLSFLVKTWPVVNGQSLADLIDFMPNITLPAARI